jgi:hypothetical protein
MAQQDSSERPEVERPEPPQGDWLFKLHDEILGPVPSTEIIERMYTGEVDESTPISLEEGDWTSIQAVGAFHPFLYDAKAKIRQQQARLEAEQAARKRRVRNMINVAIGAVALVIVSFMASYFIIVSRPWKGEDVMRAWAGKHVPLLMISSARADTADTADDSVDEETGGINIDRILIDDAPTLVAIKSPSRSKKRKRTGKKKATVDRPKDTRPKDGKTKPPDTKTASVGRLSNEEITSVVYARSNLNRLYSCIRSEIRRKTELPEVITLDFTIDNSGRVSQVRMDNIKLDGSSLHRCFRQKLTSLRFRSYAGQVRNITIPFKIGS